MWPSAHIFRYRYVDLQKAYNVLLGNLYKTLFNIAARRQAEQDEPNIKAVLEKRQRSDVTISMMSSWRSLLASPGESAAAGCGMTASIAPAASAAAIVFGFLMIPRAPWCGRPPLARVRAGTPARRKGDCASPFTRS